MTARLMACPWCLADGRQRAEEERRRQAGIPSRPTLQVWECGDWVCFRCGQLGNSEDLHLVEELLASPPQPELWLASARHTGKEARRRLWQMARRLLKQWARDGEPEAALELLVPWAQAHISPCPSREELEQVLETIAGNWVTDDEQAESAGAAGEAGAGDGASP